MAASVEDHGGGAEPRDNAGPSLAHVRQRARGLLRSQLERMRQVEAQLTEQVGALLEQANTDKERAQRQVAELQTRIDELQQGAGANGARDETDSLLEEARIALSEALREQQQLKTQLRSREDEIHAFRTQQLESGSSSGTSAEFVELQAERDSLLSKLSDAEQRIEALESGGDSTALDEMRERFETAVQEIRELNNENEQLNALLAGATREPAESLPSDGFDWESQKQQLMAQLESDFDAQDAEQAQAKLTVEGAIRITDQVVAKKEQEISELKLLLEDQSGQVGDVAIGASAVAAMLDSDELVQVERENLKQLQEEWREKLRQAEVDISIERAKLARERVTLEEKIQSFEDGQAAREGSSGGDEQTKKPAGGNWLARLGLKDDGEKEG